MDKVPCLLGGFFCGLGLSLVVLDDGFYLLGLLIREVESSDNTPEHHCLTRSAESSPGIWFVAEGSGRCESLYAKEQS